jgi:hypothetical protein
MDTRVGLACSKGASSVRSGESMALEAMESGKIERPDIVFAFCTNEVVPSEFFNGIKKAVGNGAPVVGGSAIGVISNRFLCNGDSAAGIMVLQSEAIRFRLRSATGLDRGEAETGDRLIKDILQEKEEDRLLVLFYDSIRKPPGLDSPPVLNSSSYLLDGIQKWLKDAIPVVGAGLMGDYDMNPTVQFCGSHADAEQAVGIMLSGNLGVHYRIMHGCTPLDGIYHRITKIAGPVLYEIDGRPIVEVINDMLGNAKWQNQRPLDFLTIGVNHGERFGAYKEEAYVNRLITGVTPDGKGIMIFEPDLEEGAEIQFMTRDAERMAGSARTNTRMLLESIEEKGGGKPVFGLYVDCAGRAGSYLKTDIEEAAEVQNLFNHHNVPLFGFYSGVEIAPLLGRSRGLDWTGVLLVLTES